VQAITAVQVGTHALRIAGILQHGIELDHALDG
jgi:hypothetical protein